MKLASEAFSNINMKSVTNERSASNMAEASLLKRLVKSIRTNCTFVRETRINLTVFFYRFLENFKHLPTDPVALAHNLSFS